MRFLPYERITLRTDAPPDVVATKLEGLVATTWFSLSPPAEPFRGSVRGRRFKVVRVLGTVLGLPTRNSWQPVIVGDVVPAPKGTEVRLVLRLHGFVAAFMVVWFGGLLFTAGSMVISALRSGSSPGGYGPRLVGAGEGLLTVAGMIAAGYALMSWAFWREVTKARRILAEGLGCREVENVNRLVR